MVAGSALLLAALALFAAALAGLPPAARRETPAWVRGYAVLLVFLAVSVFIGTGLAGPGR